MQDVNNIDFSIIRERALRNIREDLIAEWSDRFDAEEIGLAFDSVLKAHRDGATLDHFIPVLVEAEMSARLRSGNLWPATAA